MDIPVFPQDLERYAPWVSTHGLIAPYGKCQCGCGQDAPIAKQLRRSAGARMGDPFRWIANHHKRLYRKPLEQKFWAKVHKTDGCWEWTGARNNRGYGQTSVDRNPMLAHRFSWELHYGPIPEGIEVCHECDNPACVRPDHLFLGTHKENMDDRDSKGRQPRGEQYAHAKLTSENVIEIRQLYAAGVLHRVIAERFGISRQYVGRVARGQQWDHVELERVTA